MDGYNSLGNNLNNFSDVNFLRIIVRDFFFGRGVVYLGGRRIVKLKRVVKK